MKLEFRGTQRQRPGMQTRIIDALRRTDAKYTLLCAPTGSGKSYVGMAAMQGSESGFLVTPLNSLLDQYAEDFKVPWVKGKANYECQWEHKRHPHLGYPPTCEYAHDKYTPPDKHAPNQHTDNCEDYIPARNAFWEGPLSMTNADFLMAAWPPKQYSGSAHRSLLVIDECHKLEEKLIDLSGFKVTRKDCKLLGVPMAAFDSAENEHGEGDYDLRAMFSVYQERARHVLDPDAEDSVQKTPYINPDSIGQRKHILATAKNMAAVPWTREDEWYFDRTSDEARKAGSRDPKEAGAIIGKPLFAHHLTGRIFGKADRILFMSATPGSAEHFFKNLGIEGETAFVNEPSDWPLGRIHLTITGARFFNYANREADRLVMAEECRKIIREHPTKGLILCASYDLQKALYALLVGEFGDRLIIHTNEKGAPAKAIDEHKRRTGPTVLMGVEMHEGLDLKNDLGRFLIIPKTLYRGISGWRKRREVLDPGYCDRDTRTRMQQACGRVVRGKADWADVYILDRCFMNLTSAPTAFTKHFRRSWTWPMAVKKAAAVPRMTSPLSE